MGKFIKVDAKHVKHRKRKKTIKPKNEKWNKVAIESTTKWFTTSTNDDCLLKSKEHKNADIFFADEVKCNYECSVNKDLVYHVLDEIALEGLDGITIEALWKRMVRIIGETNLNQRIKEIIWCIICRSEHVEFFVLPTPRDNLYIHDRFKYIDYDKGHVLDVEPEHPDIYPFQIVKNDPSCLGSCSTFNTRKEEPTVRELTLQQAEERYKNTLVMVASQCSRNAALKDESLDPLLEVLPMDYCVLEKIGRSRELGDVTQGKCSLTCHFQVDTRGMYYHKKHLYTQRLIGKQGYVMQNLKFDQAQYGALLQLRRFYKRVKPKPLIIIEEIVKVLKNSPNYCMEYTKLRNHLLIERYAIAKLFKNPQIHRFIIPDLVFKYRQMYPNATPTEWQVKANKEKEKTLKVFQLRDPSVNVTATWNEYGDQSSDESSDEEEGVCRMSYNVDICRQVYLFIAQRNGVSVKDLKNHFKCDIFLIRGSLKKLVFEKLILLTKEDSGKQRNFMYYAIRKDKPDDSIVYDTKNEIISRISQIQNEGILSPLKFEVTSNSTRNSRLKIPATIPLHFNKFIYEHLKPKYHELIKKEEVLTADFTFKRKLQNFALHLVELNWPEQFNFNLKPLFKENFVYSCKNNFDFVYTESKSNNYLIKLLLLSSMFGAVVLREEINTYFVRKAVKRKFSCLKAKTEPAETESVKTESANTKSFMGPNPELIFSNATSEMKTEIFLSSEATKEGTTRKFEDVFFTKRLESRANLIISTLADRKIVDNAFDFLKIIETKEIEEGFDVKIDKKSLIRIFCNLQNCGLVKFYEIRILKGEVAKSHFLICGSMTEVDMEYLDSMCQKVKLKYFLGKTVKTKPAASPFAAQTILKGISEFNALHLNKAPPTTPQYSKTIGLVYGFRPKFQRLRIMHEFLFYLIYNYNANTTSLSKEEVRQLFDDYNMTLTDTELEELPPIYCKEISWKMFIPPMIQHNGWHKGWALLCDLVFRLPLSVFVKLHRVNFEVPEIKDFLTSPYKRYYLLRDQTPEIRQGLLHKRRYLAQFQEIFQRLSQIGLLQFGPERQKDKEQMFIYLNRRASLLDTTSTEPSYHKTTIKDYPKISFFFKSYTDVENYWYNLFTISMGTRLNARKVMIGKTITINYSNFSLVEAVKSRTSDEAMKNDKGDIPGDQRGACGLDSSLWAHIASNWTFKSSISEKDVNKLDLFGLKGDKLNKESLNYSDLKALSTEKKKVYISKPKAAIQKLNNGHEKTQKKLKGPKKIVRKITASKAIKKRIYRDHIDTILQKKIGCVRVKFSEEEDKLLLIAKAVTFFLYPKIHWKQCIPYFVLRDVVHRLNSKTHNKTSSTIQRRLTMMSTKNPNYKIMQKNYKALLKDPEISKYFSFLSYKIEEGFRYSDKELWNAFVYIMWHISKDISKFEKLLWESSATVDYLGDINLGCLQFAPEKNENCYFMEIPCEEDLQKSLIKSIIISSLENNVKHPRWNFQLFKIYQNYPDHVIRDAVNEMKLQQIISVKKTTFEKRKKILFHSPFNYSASYTFTLGTTLQPASFENCFVSFKQIFGTTEFDMSLEMVNSLKYGRLYAFNETLTHFLEGTFTFNIPHAAVTLNTENIEKQSEIYRELATRWQARLKRRIQANLAEKTSQIDEVIAEPSIEEAEKPTSLEELEENEPETINRLKSWVDVCMQLDEQRRSPSPEIPLMGEADSVKPKDNETEIKVLPEKKLQAEDNYVPTIEEIIEGMSDPLIQFHKRTVPYIGDMYGIFLKEVFINVADYNTLEAMKKHFVTHFPVINSVTIDEKKRSCLPEELLKAEVTNKEVYDHILKSCYFNFNQTPDISNVAKLQKHLKLANQIIDFLKEFNIYGASGKIILKRFSSVKKQHLLYILEELLDSGVILKTGISECIFVLSIFSGSWSVATFSLSSEDEELLNKTAIADFNSAKHDIEEKLSSSAKIQAVIRPWTKIDGSLNIETLKVWLSRTLSYCLDYPNLLLSSLFKKFRFLKPLDIFYIVEVLQKLNCVKIWAYELQEETLTSEWTDPTERTACCLDSFDVMVIKPTHFAATLLGSFLNYLDK